MSRRTTRKSKKSGDEFLGDFLQNCTEQEVVFDTDTGESPFTDLDLLADDDCLSKYLSGEMSDIPAAGSTNLDILLSQNINPSSNKTFQRKRKDPAPFLTEEVSSTCSGFDKQVVILSKPSGKGNSNSRQAVAARENRQKKKIYVTGLEKQIQALSEENVKMAAENAQQKEELEKLRADISYLKNVIANQSTLSGLLKNLKNTNGVKMTSPLIDIENGSHNLKQPNSCLKRKQCFNDVSFEMAGGKRSCTNSKSASDTENSNSATIETDTVIHTCASDVAGKPLGYIPLLSSKCVSLAAQGKSSETKINVENELHSGGVCLHVLGDSVSIEFCADCNKSATRSCSTDHAYFKK